VGKSVFLDVDGTLVDFVGCVPDSAASAIRQARDAGHRVFLCTGRAAPELWPSLVEIGFDGLIGAAGAYVEADGQVLAHKYLSREETAHVLDFFGRSDVGFFFQASDNIYGWRRNVERLHPMIERTVPDPADRAVLYEGPFRFLSKITQDADLAEVKATKVIFYDSPVNHEDLVAEFNEFDVLASSIAQFERSGELMLPGVHKASGIDVLLDHFGIDRADTLAIGDGHNDLEMLGHVAVGIAMGNAPQTVKDAADEVTATTADHGIRLAFLRHGLISE
jgi:Cof subfamily protein (haloacid dehalogenase superfamily)